jgi:acetyl esterase/lipase
MAASDYLKPFVLPVPPVEPERRGRVDFYPPTADGPRPAVVFVHGGPVPPSVTPRDWPVYRGYGSLAAANNCVGVTVDHRLHALDAYPAAAADVAHAVRTARGDARVDPARIALWFFSGGGLLLADWLRDPPPWLRCVAASYPILGSPPGQELEARFRPAEAVTAAVPMVLTRAGLEQPPIAATVEAFVEAARAAGAPLTIVDVPNGHHGFDTLDDNDDSRAAVTRAFAAVMDHLTR